MYHMFDFMMLLFDGQNGESKIIEDGVHTYSFSCSMPPEFP